MATLPQPLKPKSTIDTLVSNHRAKAESVNFVSGTLFVVSRLAQIEGLSGRRHRSAARTGRDWRPGVHVHGWRSACQPHLEKRGVTTCYAYNNAGDLQTIDYSDITPDVPYTYDRRGRRLTAVCNGITTTWKIEHRVCPQIQN